jgi:hypothetical protein
MSASHTPSLISLLAGRTHSNFPISRWIENATCEQEIHTLLLSVQGFPNTWLQWADKRILRARKRNRQIYSESGYGIASIWNGLTVLQECKFLCDTLENALRFAFINFVTDNRLSPTDLFAPKYKLITRTKKHRPWLLETSDNLIHPNLIFESDFGEIVETFTLHWKRVALKARHERTSKIGFGSLFWSDVRCRDVALFKKHMNVVREIRNKVAHSRHLLSNTDLQRLTKYVIIWLRPLNVELMHKVNAYRVNRPNFLRELSAFPPAKTIKPTKKYQGRIKSTTIAVNLPDRQKVTVPKTQDPWFDQASLRSDEHSPSGPKPPVSLRKLMALRPRSVRTRRLRV